ncbi:hypothetical protein CEP53_000177 [Fusarium sp. AF-6]|nr:hypothetical protein CEP53_000177 [Fusarium sp. AF-6]
MRVVRAIFDSVWLLRKQDEETEEVKRPDEDWIIATGSNQWNYTPLIPTKPHQVNCLESSDAPLVLRAPEHTQAHRTMELRKDLAKQSDWKGPASAEAVSLALAIETFMNFLYTLHERSIEHQPRSREFSWCVYVGKDRQAVKLTIKWSDGSWKISAGKVEAVLSLWLYSTHAQELDRRKNQERESRTGKEDDDQWIRAKGPRPEAGLKLLGPDRGRLREDYHWWMPDEGPNCLAVRETQDQMASSTWELEIDECRVVGCARTPSEPHPAQGSKQPGKTFWHIRNAEIIESSWWKELRKDSRSEGREGLAVLTHSTLERLYAQDLFTNFVWAAAEIVQWPNESRTERVSAGTRALDNLKDLRLRNNSFVRLLLKIRDTGLGSLPDVYASIISPLSLKGKLPDAVLGPIVREIIQQRVASGEWLQAGEQCWWMMDSRHKSCTAQFASIAMDFLHSLSFEIEFEKVELEYYYKTEWDIQGLEKIKQKLLRKLGKIRPEAILRGLQKLYRLKGQADEHVIPPIEGAEQGFDASDDPFLSSFKVTDLHRENFEKGSPLDFCPADKWNAGDLSGWTPLHYATARGLKSFAAELLRRRVPVDTVDCLGWTPLHHACYAGHLSIVELLVRRRASIDVTGAEGWTPLHCAVFRNHLAIVRFLRGKNASVSVFDVRGWTVFHYAAYRGFTEILVELSDGIPRHTREVNGRAPIHLAVMAKQQGVLDLLARDVDAKDSREQTPLHLTIRQDSTILTELLLRLGASVDAKNWINQTPLHLAATRGLNDAVKLLIQAKADVNAEDTERQKPLHNTVKWGDGGTVRLLIDAGAEVDVKGQFDQTPLHLAAERGYGDAVRLLIDEKVDVNARDWGGKTPLLLATEGNANKETVELLVNAGADVNAVCEEHGHTAMHHAAKKCIADVASVMLAKDRKSLKIKDKSGNLPIHYLDSPASEVMFSMFVAAGADKDATDSCGRTLIHRISRGSGSNATEFGMFLVRQGVRVDLRDKEGHTAEDYARRMSELKDLADCLHEEMEHNRDERTSQEEGEGEESSHEQR